MVDRKELKRKLPYGYKKKIAKILGVTPVAVSMYFAYKLNSLRIEKAVIRVVEKLEKEENERLDRMIEEAFK